MTKLLTLSIRLANPKTYDELAASMGPVEACNAMDELAAEVAVLASRARRGDKNEEVSEAEIQRMTARQ